MDDLTRALKEGRVQFEPVPEVDASRVRPRARRTIGHRTLHGSPIHAGIFRGAHLLDPKRQAGESPDNYREETP